MNWKVLDILDDESFGFGKASDEPSQLGGIISSDWQFQMNRREWPPHPPQENIRRIIDIVGLC